MNGRLFTLERPVNPLLQVIYLLAGGLLLIGAVLMGAVILAVVLAFALVVGIVFWVRLWWLRRRIGRGRGPRDGAGRAPGGGEIIEVEYTVVEERDRRDVQD